MRAEELQLGRNKRLDADAQPVDAACPVAAQGVRRDGPGVCLQRDLRIVRQTKSTADMAEQRFQLGGREKRRGAPAEEDRVEFDPLPDRGGEVYLMPEGRQEFFHEGGALKGIEVTVEALPLAERDMEVEGSH